MQQEREFFSTQDIELDWPQLLLNRLFIWTHSNSFLSESWLWFIQEVFSNLPEEKRKHLIVLIKLLYFTLPQWCHSVPLRYWTKLSNHDVWDIITSVILIEHMFGILTPVSCDIMFVFFHFQHIKRMASLGGEETPPNISQTDSRLKSKKPPSLMIAIPPREEMMPHDAAKQVGWMFVYVWSALR